MQLLTIKNYLENPLGKGSAFVPGAKDLKEKYINEYYSNYKLFISNSYLYNKLYYVLIKVPSKTIPEVFYDVVINVNLNDKNNFKYFDGKTIVNFPFKCFSNCPSFTYTFAQAFDDMNNLIPFLKSKYNKDIFKKESKVRNAYKIISYEKSLYLALLHITKTSLKDIDFAEKRATKIRSYDIISKNIRNTDQISQIYSKMKIKNKQLEIKNHPEVHKKIQDTKLKKGAIKNISKTSNIKKTKHIKKI